ncbi:Uncharacterised protein g6121 [Pycnogonum litorale]
MIDSSKSASGKCNPKNVQCLAHPTAFAALYGIVGIVQGSMFTYFVGTITTLEKRFAYGSQVTGLINLADNISPILLSVLIGYFASRGHRPRWCAASIILSGLSSIVYALPYFIFGDGGKYLQASSSNATDTYQLCGPHGENCGTHGSGREEQTVAAVSMLFAANFIGGIGSVGYYIIGAPLIDDSINNVQTPLYFGVLYSIRLVGPTMGFLLSSQFLRLYEDPREHPSYGSRDPRWVGAWWVGFIVIGLILLSLGSVMLLFPKSIVKDTHRKTENSAKKNIFDKMKEIPILLKILLRNPLLVFYNLAIICQLLSMVGYFVFLPKYLENEFQLSSSQSNQISGLAGVIVMVFGFLISGIVLYIFKPRPRYIMAWKVFAVFASGIGLLTVVFIGCSNQPIVTSSPCVENCGCDLSVFTPVCHESTQTSYFSPCHAGCPTTAFKNSSFEVFDECSCLPSNSSASQVILGACPSSCRSLVAFIVTLCMIKFMSASGQIGSFIVMLRSVPPKEKTLAISINATLISAFAFIPYPLIYGALVDSSCAVWEKTCSGTGHCWVYDTDKFRERLHGVSAGLFFAASFFFMIVWYLSKNIKNMYGEDVIVSEAPTTVTDLNGSVDVALELNDATKYGAT